MCSSKRLYRGLVAPVTMQVEVTSKCNCKCVHCYNYWRADCDSDVFSSNMTLEVAKRVANECIRNHVFDVVITGGEPFLNFPVAKWLAEYLKGNDIKVSFNSNLSLVNEDHAKWLFDNKIGVLTSVLGPNDIVHDSITQSPGSFSKTMRGIDLLTSIGVSLAVNVVVSQLNHLYLEETLELLCEKDIRPLFVTPAVQPEYCKDFSNFSIDNNQITHCLNLLNFFREKYNTKVGVLSSLPLCALADVDDPLSFSNPECSIGRHQIACNANGDIRACPNYNINEGSILNEDLATIWKRFEKWCYADLLPDVCLNCELLGKCNGGCRVAAETKNKRINGVDPRAKPEVVARVVDKLNSIQTQKDSARVGKSFRILPYRYREEEFGASVYGSNVTFISREAFETLRLFEIGAVYNVRDVITELSDNEKMFFLVGLSSHGILEFL